VLRIRLTRTGKKAQKSYRLVVAEHSEAVKGTYLENLGNYIPTKTPKALEFKKERILYWISKGAKPSETVASLLKKNGMEGMDKYILFKTDRKSVKKKDAKKEESSQPAPAAKAKE
jgi:small subunit ribosomal protein S16